MRQVSEKFTAREEAKVYQVVNYPAELLLPSLTQRNANRQVRKWLVPSVQRYRVARCVSFT